jgi:hypothetical protein
VIAGAALDAFRTRFSRTRTLLSHFPQQINNTMNLPYLFLSFLTLQGPLSREFHHHNRTHNITIGRLKSDTITSSGGSSCQFLMGFPSSKSRVDSALCDQVPTVATSGVKSNADLPDHRNGGADQNAKGDIVVHGLSQSGVDTLWGLVLGGIVSITGILVGRWAERNS